MGGKNPIKSWVTAPIDAVKSLGKGDIMGVIDAAGRVASLGTVSAKDVSGLTAAEERAKAAEAATAQQTEAINNLAKTTAATDANAKRRAATAEMTKTIYTTALGAVNETAESAPLKKKTLLGG